MNEEHEEQERIPHQYYYHPHKGIVEYTLIAFTIFGGITLLSYLNNLHEKQEQQYINDSIKQAQIDSLQRIKQDTTINMKEWYINNNTK